MNLLSIENLSKSFGNKDLFKNVNLGIHEEEKIGLIGKNGEGKTTFLRIIAGIEPMDSGEVIKRNDINIEYLPQNVKFLEDSTVLEQVFTGDSDNIKLVREYEEEINKENPDNTRILELTERMDRAKAWQLESQAKTILTKLGIEDFNKPISKLSGGQKRRVALAGALINPADLLILDEPTNHLDNNTIEWLEEFLAGRTGALLMVTHDRYFLDRVTNRIIELENQDISSYDGNYNYYVEKKAERDEMALSTERKRQSLYKQELAWMKQGIRARGTRQKARVERFEELKANKLNINSEEVDISVAGHRLGRKIVEIRNVSKSFGDRKIINDFSYTILRDDRIGILGENGAGKSTLMNILTGRLDADSGSIEVGETVKIGYFSQETQDMREDMRVIDYIKEGGEFIETDDGSRITAAQMMERFLFTGKEQYSPIEKLSGGERRRLYLLRVLMEGPNLLILDEPTNDLDISTLQVLENYIEEFIGPVIIVSHDRYLLDKAVEKVFHIDQGQVKEYPGNYTYFKEERLEIEELRKEVQREENKSKKHDEAERNRKRTLKLSYNEQREWDSIDEEIMELEEKIELKNKEMEEFARDYSKLEDLMEEKNALNEKLNEKMDRWLYLSELKEKIDGQ